MRARSRAEDVITDLSADALSVSVFAAVHTRRAATTQGIAEKIALAKLITEMGAHSLIEVVVLGLGCIARNGIAREVSAATADVARGRADEKKTRKGKSAQRRPTMSGEGFGRNHGNSS